MFITHNIIIKFYNLIVMDVWYYIGMLSYVK